MFDLIAVGDATIDNFVQIHDAEVRCDLNKANCRLCVEYGDKIPVDKLSHQVAGNAAILVDPNDESAISKALMLVATDKNEQKKLRELGAERIKLFSWNKTARKTLDIYRALR